MDANAGARAQAREQARQKDAVYAQEKLKFFNKETTFERALDRNIIGFGRDISDAYVQAIYTQGKGRKQEEDVVRAYFSGKKTIKCNFCNLCCFCTHKIDRGTNKSHLYFFIYLFKF